MVGINEATNNKQVTVGTTAVNVLQNDPNRKVIYIRNSSSSSTSKVTLFYGDGTPVTDTGIVLTKGDYQVESDSDGFVCWKGTIRAISNEANSTLSVFTR